VNAAGMATAVVATGGIGGMVSGALAGGEVGVLGFEMLVSQARNIQTIETAIADHVTYRDLAGAAYETAGFIIRRGGKIYSHRNEVIETARNLRAAVRALEGSLRDPRHGGSVRQLVQSAIEKGKGALQRIDIAIGR
jgi:hypothetical protein